MILKGNQRGGGRDLALHLLKDENEHVEVHEIRGFMSDDFVSALKEVHLTSKATRAKKYLYSLSVNPPANENVSTEDFLKAIAKAEKELGLTDQARAVVFHEKNGRRHAHVVWSRIDTRQMKAINIYKDWPKLQELSRELFLQHGWKMPEGLLDKRKRDPHKFTLAQWQQAKRIGKVPRQIKADLQNCWALSHHKTSFEAELKERGYQLARGDRRGFVVLDHKCEIFSLGKKWLGVHTQDIRARLGDENKLRSVEETRTHVAKVMTVQLQELQDQQKNVIQSRTDLLTNQLRLMVKTQRRERETLKMMQQERWEIETQQWQARFNKGLKGLLDFVTGKCHKIKQQNQQEMEAAKRRDEQAKDTLVFTHLEQRQSLGRRIERLKSYERDNSKIFNFDLDQYKKINKGKRNVFGRVERIGKNHENSPSRER
ncbi:MAG: relaxase/mobilization nuclease domain-containing protein [Arenicella sp.]